MARHSEVYRKPEWKKVRKEVIRRANGLCEDCKARNKIKTGKEVHHIIELTDENKHDWNIAYNPANLRLLCSDCHNDRHDRSIGLQKFLIPPGVEK